MYSVPYLALIYYSLILGGTSASRPEDTDYKSSWVEVDGLNAHYIEAGSGEPLVLVHGGLAWSSGEVNYGDVVSILGKEFHAIALDIVGFGQTKPRGRQDYSGESQASFLIGFVDKLRLGPVSLAGNSHGGFLVQYVAHERPDLVRRLIITNSLNGTQPIPPQPEGASYVYAPGGHQYKPKTLSGIRQMLIEYYRRTELVTEDRVQLVYQNYINNFAYADDRGKAVSGTVEASNYNLSYKGKHISQWAEKLEIPVLLLWSEPGSKISWGLAHFFKIPGVEMHLFPWSGHHLFVDQSERWAQVVINWLKNEPARSAITK